MSKKIFNDISGLLYLCFGAVFLFNPTYNIIDPLPDAFGYLLFFAGLSALGAVNEEALSARNAFIRLFTVECVRVCLYVSLPFVTDTFVLVLAFLLALGEAILFIPAAAHMFRGFEFLDMRLDCAAAGELSLGGRKNKKISAASIKNLTVAAFIIRAVGAVLPLLPALKSDSGVVMSSNLRDTWDFGVSLIYAVCIAVGLTSGIFWLCRFIRYINGIRADEKCCLKLRSLYLDHVSKNKVRILSAKMNSVMLLLIAAAAFSFNMYVDGVNVFPDIICAATLLAVFVMLREYGRGVSICGAVSCVLWSAVSAAGEYFQFVYAVNNYRPASAVHMIGKSPQMYLRMEICGYIEAVLYAVSVLLVMMIFTRAVDAQAKKYSFYSSREKRRFDRGLIPVIILWILSIAMSAAIMPVMKYFTEIWLINGLISIVLTVFVIRTHSLLCDGIYFKLHER